MVPVRTSCDGPLVGSYKNAKIEGKLDRIAYDSYAKKQEKFLDEQVTGLAEEVVEEFKETG